MSVINLSKKDLQNHFFSDLGIKSDDVVFLFSGLRGLGFVEKGPLGVLEVLEEYLEDGGLVIPTFTYSWLNNQEYDPLKTLAPLMGSIATESIGRAGYQRTSHPNFSVNIFTRSSERMEGLKPTNNDAFGPGSVFHNIYMNYPETRIILFGGVFNDCIYRSTFVHTAQQLQNSWHRFLKPTKDPEGKLPEVTQYVRYLSLTEYLNVNRKAPNRNFAFPLVENFEEYGRDLQSKKMIKITKIGYSESRMVTAKDSIDTFRMGLKKSQDYCINV
jgi:aminoglycoside N3'-acetyltransferase